MKFKLLKATFVSLIMTVSGLANAGLISNSNWEVVAITGNYDYATTAWYLNNNDPTLSYFDQMMSNGYIAYPQSYSSPVNGFDARGTTSVTISFDDLYSFKDIELWYTRSYSNQLIDISFGVDNTNTLFSSKTLGAYGATTNFIQDLNIVDLLDIGSFVGNQIKLSFSNTDQIIFHELTFSGDKVDVPEPSTLAIFAFGMIGLASRRFKKQS